MAFLGGICAVELREKQINAIQRFFIETILSEYLSPALAGNLSGVNKDVHKEAE